jgi:hypothetical protein
MGAPWRSRPQKTRTRVQAECKVRSDPGAIPGVSTQCVRLGSVSECGPWSARLHDSTAGRRLKKVKSLLFGGRFVYGKMLVEGSDLRPAF